MTAAQLGSRLVSVAHHDLGGFYYKISHDFMSPPRLSREISADRKSSRLIIWLGPPRRDADSIPKSQFQLGNDLDNQSD